jgi:hypothetical protein
VVLPAEDAVGALALGAVNLPLPAVAPLASYAVCLRPVVAESGTRAARSASDLPCLVPAVEAPLKLDRKASLLELPLGLSSDLPLGAWPTGASSSSCSAENLFESLRSWLPQEADRPLSPRSDVTVGGG